MIRVMYFQNEITKFSAFPEGETATPCDGWLYIYDDDGHILGMFPEKIVVEVRIDSKAGDDDRERDQSGS